MSNFDPDRFTGNPALFFARNIPNSAKTNPIFIGKGKEGRAFWHIWVA